MTSLIKIKAILGSTRQNRFSEKPGRWIFDELKKRDGVQAELLDLRDYPMPYYDEALPPRVLKKNYSNETVKKWSVKIEEADAFIIIVPEYNHGYPAVLKNALDSVYYEWNKKPVGFVSHGTVGGVRSVEQLKQVVLELQMVPIWNTINIGGEIFSKLRSADPEASRELFNQVRKGMEGDRVDAFLDELVKTAETMRYLRMSP